MIECRCPPGDCDSLVSRYIAGDRGAGDEIVVAFRPLVGAIATRVLSFDQRQEWDDAIQAAFLKLFQNVSRWRRECPFCKFVAVVASRRIIDLARESRALAPLPPSDPVDPRAAPLTDALVAQLNAAIAEFPEEWQLAWRLTTEGRSQDEIGGRLGKAPRTIRLWLAAIRDRLSRCLDDC